MAQAFPLSPSNQWMLAILSFFIVAFGQPAWLPWSGLIAGAIGFALFWRVLLAHESPKVHFYLGTLWFAAVQLVQLSWFISHPFWYIYSVYIFLAVAMGIQFGLLSLLIRKDIFLHSSFFKTLIGFLPIAALWTVFEWLRLFALSGFSFNPLGITLSGNLYALQAASLAGVLGLSFWVILTNLFALWAWIQKKLLPAVAWLIAFLLPYIYGIVHVSYHDGIDKKDSKNLNALLVQTAFSPEESKEFSGRENLIDHVINEWGKILEATKKHHGKDIDLIVLPEFVVPFGTYSDIYPLAQVKRTFYEVLGPESLKSLPKLDHPFVSLQKTILGPQLMVNNAYWVQGLANFFDADVLIGLEDAEDVPHGTREYYSAAIFIHPQMQKDGKEGGQTEEFKSERYSKRVLVPMGEYIPFEACKKFAARYGVFGSFTCGEEAVIMNSKGIDFSPSICYEETFGDIMSEGRQKGADLFVNLTSDVWYPDSKLPRQHMDHARLRTVENGVPLIRSCNTGITAAIDSLGRDIAVLGGDNPEAVEWVSDSLLVNVPVYSYSTLYSRFGDRLIIGVSLAILVAALVGWLIRKK